MDVSKDIAHQLRETLETDEGPAAEAVDVAIAKRCAAGAVDRLREEIRRDNDVLRRGDAAGTIDDTGIEDATID